MVNNITPDYGNLDLSFKPLRASSIGEVAEIISRFDPYSDFNFTSLHSWNDDNTTMYCTLNDNLVIKMKNYDNSGYILSMIGDTDIDSSLHALLNFAKNTNSISNSLGLIPEIVIENITNTVTFKITEDTDNHDYILSTQEAVNLEGSKYANKRKNINRFLRKYSEITYVKKMDLTDADTVRKIETLNSLWAQQNRSQENSADDDINAISKLINDPEYLLLNTNIQCIGVFVDKQLSAYCIYENLGKGWAISHFGKAINDFKSLYEFMMIGVLRDLHAQGVKLMNYEQDLGIPGLRHSKQNSKPVKFLKKYSISSN